MDRRWLLVTGALIGALGIALNCVDYRPSRMTADGSAGTPVRIVKESGPAARADGAASELNTARATPLADPAPVSHATLTQTAQLSRPALANTSPDRTEPAERVASAKLLGEWMTSPPPVEDDGTMPFRSAQTLHRELEAQGRDADWSESAEAQLRAYLTFMAKGGWIDIASIRCGESMCEIQAATRSPEALTEDNEDWQGIVMSMPQQPWWSTYGFDDPTLSSKSMPDGRLMYVGFVRRKTG